MTRTWVDEDGETLTLPPVWPMPPKNRTMGKVEPALREIIRRLIGAVDPWPLFLHGEAGSGKSCAGMCLVDAAGSGAYATIADLCRALIDAQHNRIPFFDFGASHLWSEGELWWAWSTANVCVLDEIGVREKVSDHHYQTLQKALDRRIDSELPLVVISNINLAGIGELYDDRIVSRLSCGTVVEMKGDRRLAEFS